MIGLMFPWPLLLVKGSPRQCPIWGDLSTFTVILNIQHEGHGFPVLILAESLSLFPAHLLQQSHADACLNRRCDLECVLSQQIQYKWYRKLKYQYKDMTGQINKTKKKKWACHMLRWCMDMYFRCKKSSWIVHELNKNQLTLWSIIDDWIFCNSSQTWSGEQQFKINFEEYHSKWLNFFGAWTQEHEIDCRIYKNIQNVCYAHEMSDILYYLKRCVYW